MSGDPPRTQYARAGGVHIAYQVLGDGPLDLVWVPGWVSHLDMQWEEPRQAAFIRSLASFSRLIMYDKRGTGVSDPVPVDQPPTLEDRMDDVLAVMDAVDSESAAFFGFSEGGAMASLFAATFPERTKSLVLWGANPRISAAPDWPHGVSREDGLQQLKSLEEGNFTEMFGVDFFVPSMVGDAEYERWWERAARLAASPAMYISLIQTNGRTDVRDVLPLIDVPTLVLHRSGDKVWPVQTSQFMAEQIPNARYVELDGADHWPWIGDSHAAVTEIQEFLVGTRPDVSVDRFLTTVLFTDIVDSTARASQVGDAEWTKILDHHELISATELQKFGGRWVKGTGDGMLATFDGPGRAVSCARGILDRASEQGLSLRAGIHTGEAERRGEDIAGMAVHIASRVSAEAGPNQILVTSTVRDLTAGSGLVYESLGTAVLKGVPGEWQLLAVGR